VLAYICYIGIIFFLLGLILIFSVLAKRMAANSVSDMTYLVSSETLNLNSIHNIRVNACLVPAMHMSKFEV